MTWLLEVVLVTAAVLSLASAKVLGPDFPFLVWLALRGRKPSQYEFQERERLKTRQHAVGA
jgi:hypothetical protein